MKMKMMNEDGKSYGPLYLAVASAIGLLSLWAYSEVQATKVEPPEKSAACTEVVHPKGTSVQNMFYSGLFNKYEVTLEDESTEVQIEGSGNSFAEAFADANNKYWKLKGKIQ